MKKRLIGLVCLILSAIMLLTNYASFKASSSFDFSDYGEEVSSLFDELSYEAKMLGLKINTKKIDGVAQCLLDGKISPREAHKISSTIKPVIRKLSKEYAEYLDYFDVDLRGIPVVLGIYNLLYSVTVVLFLLSLALLKSKMQNMQRKVHLIYMITNIVLALGLSLAVLSVSEDVQLRLTISPFLTIIFTVASFVFIKPGLQNEEVNTEFVNNAIRRVKQTWDDNQMSEKIAKTVDAEKIREKSAFIKKESEKRIKEIGEKISWKCPNCGQLNGSKNNFCASCGQPKPEQPKCPKCGTIIKGSPKFCINCGALLEKGTPVDPKQFPYFNTDPERFYSEHPRPTQESAGKQTPGIAYETDTKKSGADEFDIENILTDFK